MGWGRGRFPVMSQLNAMTATAERRQALATFFANHYSQANPYTLGSLCRDWDQPRYGVAPPWDEDEDNPWHGRHADEWKDHCQDQTVLPANVRADLETWIVYAIQNREQIVYKFRRRNTAWVARRTNIGSGGTNVWEIVVEGRGF